MTTPQERREEIEREVDKQFANLFFLLVNKHVDPSKIREALIDSRLRADEAERKLKSLQADANSGSQEPVANAGGQDDGAVIRLGLIQELASLRQQLEQMRERIDERIFKSIVARIKKQWRAKEPAELLCADWMAQELYREFIILQRLPLAQKPT